MNNKNYQKELRELTILANKYKEAHKEEKEKIHNEMSQKVLRLLERNFSLDEIALYIGSNEK